MNIQGILFDKDDTIIDLETFWRMPIQKTAEYIAALVTKTDDGALIAALQRAAGFERGRLIAESPVAAGTNKDVIQACLDVLGQRGIDPAQVDRAKAEAFLEKACLAYGEVRGKADFQMLLPQLRQKGLFLGVATSDSYASVMHCLHALGIAGLFDLILTADRVPEPKPAPDMAQLFCTHCGITPQNVLMVGDSDNDMRFAKNSGMRGVLYRPKNARRELPEGAACTISDFNTLFEILNCALPNLYT